MPRKTGLGKAVENSLTSMSHLVTDLEKFGTKTCREILKKNIASSSLAPEEKEPLLKMINDMSKVSLDLSNKVDDVIDRIKAVKPKGNSRFATNVVRRFLEKSI